jgi:hypothetical protein
MILNTNLDDSVGMNYIERVYMKNVREEIHDADREGDDKEWGREMVCRRHRHSVHAHRQRARRRANRGSAQCGAGDEGDNTDGTAQDAALGVAQGKPGPSPRGRARRHAGNIASATCGAGGGCRVGEAAGAERRTWPDDPMDDHRMPNATLATKT